MKRAGLAGLAALAFAIPWEDTLTLPGAGTLARLVGIAAAGVGVFAILARGTIRAPSWGWTVFVAFVGLIALSGVWSLDPAETADRAWTFAQLAVMVWLIGEFAPDRASQRVVLGAYVLGALVAIASTWSAFLSGSAVAEDRYAASGFNPNDLAFVLALGIPMAWFLAITTPSRRVRVLAALYPVAAVATVLLTASRGGTVMTIIALLVIPATWTRAPIELRRPVAGAAVACVLLVPALIPAASLERVMSTADEIGSGTLNARTDIWKAGARIFASAPGLGIGAGAFSEGVRDHLGNDYPAHNVYLAVLVDLGLVGFVLFAAVLLLAIHAIHRASGLERRALAVLIIVLLVGFLSTNWEWRKQTWLILGLLLARSPLR